MLKYRRCLDKKRCDFQRDDPMTGAKLKACFMTNGTCEYCGCKMFLPTTEEEHTLIAQARQEGRKEVMDWIKSHPLVTYGGTAASGESHYEISYSELQRSSKSGE